LAKATRAGSTLLFGRDSLISSLQLLPVRPDLARATLRALADRQGRVIDPVTLEAPGKIGHEFRREPPRTLLDAGWPHHGEFNYFASADATTWFLVVLGFLRHARSTTPGGLVQQGWRDSHGPHDPSGGGILDAHGRPPGSGLADADTQAVAYAALRALGTLDPDARWADRARAFRSRVSGAFGPEDMAIEPDGAGALEPPAAAAAAARLCEPDVLTAFGLRTLSSGSPAFDPHAYHRGSIWPFDSWIGWVGLRAHRRIAAAERVRTGVLAAIERLGGAPELYAVTRTGELEPTALSTAVRRGR
jgi:glycogen debranching enzyme